MPQRCPSIISYSHLNTTNFCNVTPRTPNSNKSKKKSEKLPFVTMFSLQNYVIAEKGFNLAQDNNYQSWYIDCSLNSDTPSQWNKKRISQLRKLIKSARMKPLIHGNFKIPLASDIDELRLSAVKYTKKEIKLAAALEAPLILHGGAIVEPRLIIKAKRKALNNYLQSLITLKVYADKLNVPLYLENLSNYKYYRPFHYIFTHDEEFQYILDRIDLPFFLDIGHANIGNKNPIDTFKKFYKRIIGISLSNNDGLTDQHLGLNEGSIDYRQLIHTIINLRWKGVVAFETRGKRPDANIQELINLYYQAK